MPLIKYVPRKFSASSMAIIDTANEIIDEYAGQGYSLTLRQLYYQFVARDLIANKQSEYKRLGSIINDARLAGLVDWEAIEDRTRGIESLSHWDSPSSIVETCARQYREDKWADQDARIEVWIEKEALAGVFARACDELDVPYLSCRGYTSQSEMWRASMRLRAYERQGQETYIFHFGDHDPSGIDMTRDIVDRLRIFGSRAEVRRLALNMDQVDKYKPPPNPAKLTDARADKYIEDFGYQSWELDALDPKTLSQLVRKAVVKLRDDRLWKQAEAREQQGRERLQAVAREL